MKRFLFLCAILGANLIAACSMNVAGGTSEETNTVAGTLSRPDGTPAARAAVLLRSTVSDSAYADTTDSLGRYSLLPKAYGQYGLSAEDSAFAFYDTISFYGKSISRDFKLSETDSISGFVFLREGEAAANATVEVAGSPWKTATDENGYFVLNSIPSSGVPLSVSPGLTKYISQISYDVSTRVASSGEASAKDLVIRLPLATDYALVGVWDFNNSPDGETVPDSRGLSGKARLYGDAKIETFADRNRSLRLQKASDFAVIEDDRGILDSAKAFTVEAWVNFQGAPDDSAKIRNIVGKLGFNDSAVFSLSLLRDTCDVKGFAFGFFVSDGTSPLSCSTAVTAPEALPQNRWIYLAASWDGKTASLFIDGALAGTVKTDFENLVGANEIPIYFGKENLDIAIDDVRISTTAIDSVDARYRFQN